MQDLSDAAAPAEADAAPAVPTASPAAAPTDEVVSTHVLVPEGQAQMLRELSKKTRVAQSEYLREAVDDVLDKYGKLPAEGED